MCALIMEIFPKIEECLALCLFTKENYEQAKHLEKMYAKILVTSFYIHLEDTHSSLPNGRILEPSQRSMWGKEKLLSLYL